MALQIGNIRLGVPVRVTRKQPDPSSIYGGVFVYDGLYDVVSLGAFSGAFKGTSKLSFL